MNNYMLLNRLQTDCEFYLNAGCQNRVVLWAGDEKEQIAKMKELWNGLQPKPTWLSMEEIEEYEKKMC